MNWFMQQNMIFQAKEFRYRKYVTISGFYCCLNSVLTPMKWSSLLQLEFCAGSLRHATNQWGTIAMLQLSMD